MERVMRIEPHDQLEGWGSTIELHIKVDNLIA